MEAQAIPSEVAYGDTFLYTVSVSSSEKEFPVPTFPPLEAFTVLSQVQSLFEYPARPLRYVQLFLIRLRPKYYGPVTIEPCLLRVGEETFQSQQLIVTVRGHDPAQELQRSFFEQEEGRLRK